MRTTEICMEMNYFIFRNRFFKIDAGTSMGNPLSPLISEVFMAKLETNLKESLVSPRWWCFRCDKKEWGGRDTTNEEENKNLAFLDLKLTRFQNKIELAVHHKPTETHRYITNVILTNSTQIGGVPLFSTSPDTFAAHFTKLHRRIQSHRERRKINGNSQSSQSAVNTIHTKPEHQPISWFETKPVPFPFSQIKFHAEIQKNIGKNVIVWIFQLPQKFWNSFSKIVPRARMIPIWISSRSYLKRNVESIIHCYLYFDRIVVKLFFV